jgi:hypothetical protein
MVVAGSVCPVAQDRAPSADQRVGVVMGVVRFARGVPIADVRVVMVVPGDRLARSARTGADGSYRFDAVPAGEYQISVSHPGSVAKRIRITPDAELSGVDFSIQDGGSRRVVRARVVMNAASAGRRVPERIGIGVRQSDGTLAVPLAPGDQRLVVRLPDGYFLDSAMYGSVQVYSLEQVGGRRLTAGPFTITVPPEPQSIPELTITVGAF